MTQKLVSNSHYKLSLMYIMDENDNNSIFNINILQRFRNKILRSVVDGPYFVTNRVLLYDIPLESDNEAIHRFSSKYCERVSVHPIVLVNRLNMPNSEVRRLKRLLPFDTTGLRFSDNVDFKTFKFII